MARTSTNLSDKLFFTIQHSDGTSYFGELEGRQKILLKLSCAETQQLKQAAQFIDDLDMDNLDEDR